MAKFHFLFLISFFAIIACHQESKEVPNPASTTINTQLASLYPINHQWIELQTLQYVKNGDEHRNFKLNTSFTERHWNSSLFSKWCDGEYCYQLDEFLQLKKQASMDVSEESSPSDINYLIPLEHQIIAVSSVPEENIFTIRAYDQSLNELWSTIYERSRTDSNGIHINYAEILGYNQHILAYHSSSPQIPKSGFIDLSNGRKKQDEQQWNALLIDEDLKTVLGEIIQNADLSYAIQIGNNRTQLPASTNGYSHVQALVNKDIIYLGFYYAKSNIIKLLALDYHSRNTLWTTSISSSKPINDLYFSAFQNLFIVETLSNQDNGIYIYNADDGQELLR